MLFIVSFYLEVAYFEPSRKARRSSGRTSEEAGKLFSNSHRTLDCPNSNELKSCVQADPLVVNEEEESRLHNGRPIAQAYIVFGGA